MQLQLRRLRKEAGYKNRSNLAHALGVSSASVAAWEMGKRVMSFDNACRIADVLGCSLDELAGRSRDVEGYFAVDERLNEIRRNFEELDETGRDLAAGAVRGIAGATASGRTQDDCDKDASA